MRILALTKYGDAAASTRQRFLQYRRALEEAGFQLQISPLLDNRHVLGLSAGTRANPLSVGMSYARRLSRLMTSSSEIDALWVHCELFPYLPAFFERLAFRPGKPVVFDYDDAIFHNYDSILMLRSKLRPLIAGADAVIAGNEYLADYARRENPNVQVVPTVVDTSRYVPVQKSGHERTVIGWIGSPSTWPYVRPLLPTMEALCRTGRARFLVVGGGRDAENDQFPGMEAIAWTEDREIADVQSMDIGIMPLPDEPWARGKSGYKLIQYMGCGLPVVASPVGVNSSIVTHDVNGYLCENPADWGEALRRLIVEPDTARRLGEAGRAKTVAKYSLKTHSPRLVELFRSL